ncbi:hypothetical protein SAMN05216600_11770 [Pseudomonas cuatrocienegasensis]|uniref:PD-(D/E)XK nuclease superfamily protein n=1 Tax=Pseudomonas cuatrocienegasensis TaxID=543360 RepID=A0ABY1BMU3_9PSED|nr:MULTISPECIES: hypothetical protein [Pseudomonas]OEC34466.1 hypothetical protein A7D25_13995 [Pseudomonas sp. 21C1]SER20059.1 hypothetical protein SAMN05216600_11770 [Pseudomonas cuatrocienegasensis]
MLNAVLAGKKRGTGLQNPHAAPEMAEGAEDVLTASVFERLSYLPEALLSKVMTTLLGTPFGALQSIDYWPSWYLPSGTRVEPDVLLRDEKQTLLVEAKRHDGIRQQDAGQLANELLAGWEEDCLGEHCLLLTLGGLVDTHERSHQQLLASVLPLLPAGSAARFTLVCRSWQQLYQALETHIDPDTPIGCRRLLDDIAQCYAWHGLRTHPMRWLNNLKPLGLSSTPASFAAWKLK